MRHTRAALALAILAALVTGPLWAAVAEAQNLDRQVEATLRSLYETTPAARELARTAKGIVVFPEIARDNYVLGLQSGHGALLVGGKIVAHVYESQVQTDVDLDLQVVRGETGQWRIQVPLPPEAIQEVKVQPQDEPRLQGIERTPNREGTLVTVRFKEPSADKSFALMLRLQQTPARHRGVGRPLVGKVRPMRRIDLKRVVDDVAGEGDPSAVDPPEVARRC